jgi:alpha-L-fucosidase
MMTHLVKLVGVALLITLFYVMMIDTERPITAPPENGSIQTFDERMQWWREARFGMFIHWGPVSLKGTEIGWSRGEEIPVKTYDNLYKQFNPSKFDANQWVSIAKSAGMKYMVITSKHHDGFCLWDTKTTLYNIMSTPFKRDVIRELSDACKKENLTFCTYYSILDWYHPDYNLSSRGGPGYRLPAGTSPDMDRYVSYMEAHLKELITDYGPLGVLWFDGEWEDPWTDERGLVLYNYCRNLQPDLIINNRVDKKRDGMKGTSKNGRQYIGDFETPEQRIGKFNSDRPWESCITIGKQWAWKPDDEIKSLKECIGILVNTVGGDGNLLLNIGPMPNGEIEPRQVKRLRQIGHWLDKFGESIYRTRGGPILPQSWGVSTHRDNIIYLHILQWPEEKLVLETLPQKISKATSLTGGKVSLTRSDKGYEIQMASSDRDPIDTIVVLELEEQM